MYPSVYRPLFLHVVAFGCLLAALPAAGQVRPSAPMTVEEDTTPIAPLPPRTMTNSSQAGRVADSSVGQVGQRQGRAQLNPTVQPMARISNRIQNRVQSRIRNRIDRAYDPQANAASPFAVAEDETRTTPR